MSWKNLRGLTLMEYAQYWKFSDPPLCSMWAWLGIKKVLLWKSSFMFFRSVKFSADANIKIWTGFWSKMSRYWSKTNNRQFLKFPKVPSYFPGVFKSSELLPWRFYKFRKFRDTSLAFLQVPKVPSYFPGVFTNSESSEILPWRFYKFRNWTLAEFWAFYTDVFRFYILFF